MLMKLKRILVKYQQYAISVVALSLTLSGLLLMIGECSTTEYFNPVIFSTQRIIIAPILCFIGYLLFIPAIIWLTKVRKSPLTSAP